MLFRNNESINNTLPESSSDKWVHFAVSTSTTLNFYYNGEMIYTQATSVQPTVPANANVELTIDGESGLFYILMSSKLC